MAVAFSSNDRNVIERAVDELELSTLPDISPDDLELFFEIDSCVRWINENDYKNATLQFPDALLKYAPEVAFKIEQKTNGRVAILGDTSYGECCVDEVAAEHVGADSLIHFGHACMTATSKLPVFYAFTVLPIDLEHLSSTILSEFPERDGEILIFYDVQYHHGFLENPNQLQLENVYVCPPSSDDGSISDSVKCGRKIPDQVERSDDSAKKIIYVGDSDRYSTLLALTFPTSEHFRYSPSSRMFCPAVTNIKRTLMKRHFVIEKAKDAQRIGMLVGTLGAVRYADIITRIRSTIRESGKKAYTFLVGKPNVPKLANFPEIDLFVLVSCPENSMLGIDCRDFLQPVITPYELDVALNKHRNWSGMQFISDFRHLLPGSRHYREFEKCAEPDVSLITGRVRNNVEDNDKTSDENLALAVQDTRVAEIHRKGGGEFLNDRTWRGLEQKLGETGVKKAVKGRSGIAAGYEGELRT